MGAGAVAARGEQAGQRSAKHARNRSLLAGRLVDEEGEPLVATQACKGKIRYRYYVSRGRQHDPDADSASGMRIPAREIKAAVADRVAEALDDPITLTAMAGFTLQSGDLRQTMAIAEGLTEQVRAKDYQLVRKLVSSVRIKASEITIELSSSALGKLLKLERDETQPDIISFAAKVRLTRTGRTVRLVHSNGLAATAGIADPRTCRAAGHRPPLVGPPCDRRNRHRDPLAGGRSQRLLDVAGDPNQLSFAPDHRRNSYRDPAGQSHRPMASPPRLGRVVGPTRGLTPGHQELLRGASAPLLVGAVQHLDAKEPGAATGLAERIHAGQQMHGNCDSGPPKGPAENPRQNSQIQA